MGKPRGRGNGRHHSRRNRQQGVQPQTAAVATPPPVWRIGVPKQKPEVNDALTGDAAPAVAVTSDDGAAELAAAAAGFDDDSDLTIAVTAADVGEEPEPADDPNLALSIDVLDMGVTQSNALKREGIKTVGELVGKTEKELLDIRLIGSKTIDHITLKLSLFKPPLSLTEPAEDE